MHETIENPDPDVDRLVQYVRGLGVGCRPKSSNKVLAGYEAGITLLIFFVPAELEVLSNVAQAVDENNNSPDALLRIWQQAEFVDPTAADCEQMIFADLMWRAPICVDEMIAAIERVRYKPFASLRPLVLEIN